MGGGRKEEGGGECLNTVIPCVPPPLSPSYLGEDAGMGCLVTCSSVPCGWMRSGGLLG